MEHFSYIYVHFVYSYVGQREVWCNQHVLPNRYDSRKYCINVDKLKQVKLPPPNNTSLPDKTEEDLLDTIDQDLVKWALIHQKNGKIVGPDGLPAEATSQL